MEMFDTWMKAVTKPAETLAAEKKNAALVGGVIQFATVFGIASLLMGIKDILGGNPVAAVVSISIGLIMSVILGVLLTLVVAGVQFIIAKVLGGSGSFSQQYYLGAIVLAPLMLINSVLNLIPIIGGIIGFLVFLYMLYVMTLAIKEAHQFEIWKAVVVWLIPGIIAMALFMATILAMLVAVSGIAKGSAASNLNAYQSAMSTIKP